MPILNPLISIIVPVYNEEQNIKPFLSRMEAIVNKLQLRYEIIFCLDPSPDNTETTIRLEIERNKNIGMIKFSRRFGQPAATMAGINYCKGDICVIIDVDLQDPPELIEQMIDKWKEGYYVVYATRQSRKGETITKHIITFFGYRVIKAISDIEIPVDTGDFRLMDRRVINELKKMNDTYGFLRGLVPFVGFKQISIKYNRKERTIGTTNYNKYIGGINTALHGIFGFSARPLQIASILGGVIALLSFILGIYALFQKLILHTDMTPGLTMTTMLITFLAGIQLLSLGIIGEYIGRIYDEVRKRPLYIVETTENII